MQSPPKAEQTEGGCQYESPGCAKIVAKQEFLSEAKQTLMAERRRQEKLALEVPALHPEPNQLTACRQTMTETDLRQRTPEQKIVEQSWFQRTFGGLDMPDVDISPQEVALMLSRMEYDLANVVWEYRFWGSSWRWQSLKLYS